MKKNMLTQTAFGREQGVSQQQVSKWIVAGMPTKDGRIVRKDALTWLKRNVERRARETDGGSSLADARRRKETALAKLRELELQIKQGQFVDLRDVEEKWGEMIVTAKSRLLALPTRLAPEVASESDAAACHNLIRDAIYEALEELSQELERQAAGGEAGKPAAGEEQA